MACRNRNARIATGMPHEYSCKRREIWMFESWARKLYTAYPFALTACKLYAPAAHTMHRADAAQFVFNCISQSWLTISTGCRWRLSMRILPPAPETSKRESIAPADDQRKRAL